MLYACPPHKVLLLYAACPLSMQMGIPLTLPALRAGSQALTKRCHLQTHSSLFIDLCGCASAGSKVIRGIIAREEGEPGDEATFVVVFKFNPLGKKKALRKLRYVTLRYVTCSTCISLLKQY